MASAMDVTWNPGEEPLEMNKYHPLSRNGFMIINAPKSRGLHGPWSHDVPFSLNLQ